MQGLNGEPVKLGADQKVTVEEAPSCAAGEDEEWWIHMKKRETVGIQHTRFNVSPPVEEEYNDVAELVKCRFHYTVQFGCLMSTIPAGSNHHHESELFLGQLPLRTRSSIQEFQCNTNTFFARMEIHFHP